MRGREKFYFGPWAYIGWIRQFREKLEALPAEQRQASVIDLLDAYAAPIGPEAELGIASGYYRALIIGNDKYQDSEGKWKGLNTAVRDAHAVAGTGQADDRRSHHGRNRKR